MLLNFKHILLFAVIITAISCEKIIPFSSDINEPKLVVNSLFDNTERWRVHVSKSLSVIDNAELTGVENASVIIYDSIGNIIETLVHDSGGFYTGGTMPQTNNTYRIDVSANNYNSVYALETLPKNIPILSVDTFSIINIDNEKELHFDIEFTDPSEETNYYILGIDVGFWEIYDLGAGLFDSTFTEITIPLYSNDQSSNNNETNNKDGSILFEDLLFNGQNKKLSVYSYIENISWSAFPITFDYIHVNLFNISEATYLYNRTYSIYQNSSGNPFAQAVQVYSNITNGFGIFGGAQKNVFSL
jgi:hypothetical protein